MKIKYIMPTGKIRHMPIFSQEQLEAMIDCLEIDNINWEYCSSINKHKEN